MQLTTSWERQGLEQGLERGLEQGLKHGRQAEALAFVLRLLQRRVGAPSPQLQERLRELSPEELEMLGEALFDISTLAEVEAWLVDRQA